MPLLNQFETITGTHWRILVLSWLGWWFDFYILMLYPFVQTAAGKELNLNDHHQAWLHGMTLAFTAVGGVLFGVIGDRIGRRRTQQISIVTYALGSAATFFVRDFTGLLAARCFTGLGVGGQWSAGHTLLAETFPAHLRGRFGALLQTGAPLGLGLAVVMGSFVASHLGWRETFLISAFPPLIVALLQTWMPESDVWLANRKTPTGVRPSLTESFQKSVAMLFFGALVLTILNMSNYWIAFNWLPKYLVQDRGIELAKSGAWFLVLVLGSLTGYVAFGFCSDRLGRRLSFTIFSVLMAVGLSMITLFWSAIEKNHSMILAFMFLAGVGTGTWSNFGPMFSELFPTHLRNTGSSVAMNVGRGAQFFVQPLIPVISSAYGLGGAISLAAICALLAGAWIWTLPETRAKAL